MRIATAIQSETFTQDRTSRNASCRRFRTNWRTPIGWEPYDPESTEDESRILNAIRSKVSDRIDEYCKITLVRDPRTGAWLPAYENISGPGTKIRRARTIARILEDRAQLPSEGLGKFTKDVWQIVEETIATVCSPEPQKKLYWRPHHSAFMLKGTWSKIGAKALRLV